MTLAGSNEQTPSGRPSDRLAAHTLVIPTFNRPALLLRLVTYYASRAPAMPLLVLDSSEAETAARNAAALAVHGAQTRHMTFPGTMPMATKLSRGLAAVETPTVSFCADDDIVFPDGLRDALAFLADHPDYVSAHGLYLNFGEHGHSIHVTREYAGPSNEAGHPGARIYRLCQDYESLFYGVFRTRDLRDIFDAVAELDTLHYQELFQSIAALIKGKVKRFPKFYAARRSGPAAEPTRDKWQTYYWFADDATEFVQHYVAYRERLFAFYNSHGSEPRLDRKAFFKTLDLAHAVYFSKACPPAYFHSVLQPYWPDDKFIEKRDDLFQLIRHGATRGVSTPTERLLIKVLRRLRRWQRPIADNSSPAAAVAALNSEIHATFRTAWICELPLALKWIASNDDFRASYRELCIYLDTAP